ncbi:CNH domain-containing protein [Phthorimaea operculella]|nr:CNH domain-containing protein [Phthorimaea operculella]
MYGVVLLTLGPTTSRCNTSKPRSKRTTRSASSLCSGYVWCSVANIGANDFSVQHEQAKEQAHHALCQLALLRERLESREARVAELEMRNASLEGEKSSAEAALSSAVRRVRELQEECSQLRTRAHEHHSQALQLQASLQDAQEEISAIREASEAANAWWRTRETKADSTLRQQAKLIDFLQAKVEEAGRKKCSLSNKLFGRSGRRSAASPPLRRANRELREEVDRLRAKLSAHSLNGDMGCPTPIRTPRSSVKKPAETPNGDVRDSKDDTVAVIWPDGSRERVQAKCRDGQLVLYQGDKEIKARLIDTETKHSNTFIPQNEANRAFCVQLDVGGEGVVVCASVSERANWVSQLIPAPTGYAPPSLVATPTRPVAALHVAPNAIAIGSEDGLLSLRGPIALEFDTDFSPPRHSTTAVTSIVATAGRALAIYSGVLVHSGLLALGSALRRASNLKPSVGVSKVRLPDVNSPHLVKAITPDSTEGACAAVACGRRVFLLRYDAATTEFRVARSFTVDRPPTSLLLTGKTLYIAGEKPLKVNLPNGALEAFAMDEPIISAAAKKQSAPKAILLIREKPAEILLCYSECGVFVDDNGRRTRNDDAKWSSAVQDWEYVAPFLYLVGEEKVTIIHITDEAYRAPPCTCDTASLASSASECYMPEKFNLKVKEPALLGTTPDGIIIRTKSGDSYNVAIVEGKMAFKSIGASIESLSTISDSKRSSTDSGQSTQHYMTIKETNPHHESKNRESYQQNNRESYGQIKRESYGQNKSDSYAQIKRESYGQNKGALHGQNRMENYEQVKRESNGQRRESQNKRDSNQRRSINEESPQDLSHVSQESVEPNTGFLSDIRKRARQLRKKNRKDRSPEDVIKEILTTEVGLKRLSAGRMSPARISDSESDSEPEQNGSESSSAKGTADLCAEMFSRQVRFQNYKE